MHDKYFDHEPRGEFRGDFSRDTYDPFRHFSRVLMQQGRVQLDADWNEQVSIFWHYLRALGRDIGGEHWGPWDNETRGFKIEPNGDNNLLIGMGVYYVQGVLCENLTQELLYSGQDGYPFPDSFDIDGIISENSYLVYLDVWERHLTYAQDDYMREIALGGPDTAARSKIEWQVKLKEIEIATTGFKENYQTFLDELGDLKKPGSGPLRARARKDEDESEDPCLVSPEARYRGAENQLYRVEIHQGGAAGKATFKWSRENGAVIFPIRKIEKADTTIVTLEHLGRDSRFGLNPDDWVEIVDDYYTLRGQAEPLLQVKEIDHEKMEVKLKIAPTQDLEGILDRHPYLRRWDHSSNADDGAVQVVESSGEEREDWILLEDGVRIQFPAVNQGVKPVYKTGDYWIIPARTATGDVQWPQTQGNMNGLVPKSLSPHGVEHYYAPLAVITVDVNGGIQTDTGDGLRRKLKKPWLA